VGTTHQVAAPAEQVFRGRRWVFAGWSNGGPAAQSVTVPEEAAEAGLRLVVRYEMLARLRIESAHEVPVQVNGSTCRTPLRDRAAAGQRDRVASAAGHRAG
jgi:hypothetical protein